MRLTVGGLFLITALTGAGYIFFDHAMVEKGLVRLKPFRDQLVQTVDSLKKADFKSIPVPFFSKGKSENPSVEKPLVLRQNLTSAEGRTNTGEPIPVESPTVQSAPEITKPIVQPLQREKPISKRRLRKASRKKVVTPQASSNVSPAPVVKKPTTAPRTAAGKSGYEKLVGSYVSMKLMSGNEVKGILKEITGTEYKLELPGLGDFMYQHAKVKQIELAK